MIAESKKNKKKYKETLFSILIVVLFIGLILFLIISNVRVNKKRAQYLSKIESIKEEIRILEEKNKELRENASNAESEEHLEQVAREQLGMKSPGEEVVVITKEDDKEDIEETKEEKNYWNPKNWWDWLTGNR